MKYLSCDGENQEQRESTNLGNFVPSECGIPVWAKLYNLCLQEFKWNAGYFEFSDIIKNTDKTCAYLMHNKLIGFIFMEGPW